jgi:hypothetical protein
MGLLSVITLLSSFAVAIAFAMVAIFIAFAMVAIFTALAWLTRMVMTTLSTFAVVAALVRGRANGTRSTTMIGIAAEFVGSVSLHETEDIGLGLGLRSGSGAGPCVTVAALRMCTVYRYEFNIDVCKDKQTYTDDKSVFVTRNSERDRKSLCCRESRDDGKCLKCSEAHR